MARNAPGKHFRKGLSLIELHDMFPSDESAEAWFVGQRWPDGVACPECSSRNIQKRQTRKPQPYRCRDCRKDFSAKTGSVMQGSPLPFRTWAIAIYLVTTSLKGVSSMKVHRGLRITQKSAWHMLMRLRETYEDCAFPFDGPVEADETFIGGLEENKHRSKKLRAGRGCVGKAIVAGARDRDTGKVVAKVVPDTAARTLQGFVEGVSQVG